MTFFHICIFDGAGFFYICILKGLPLPEPLVSGFRLCLRGCNANNGAQSGPAALNVNNAVSDANVNWGSPLNYFWKEDIFYRERDLASRRKIN